MLRLSRILLITLIAAGLTPAPGWCESFLESDDYRDDDEVVGRFSPTATTGFSSTT